MRFTAVQHVTLSVTTNINKFVYAQLICCCGIHSERKQGCSVRICRIVKSDKNKKSVCIVNNVYVNNGICKVYKM